MRRYTNCSEEYWKTGLPLINRIEKALSHAKNYNNSNPCSIVVKLAGAEETLGEMKPLLEEILDYMRGGVLVKSKDFKNTIL